MTRFKLVPYSIRVKKRETKEYVPLNDLDGRGKDFLKIAQKLLNSLRKTKIIRANKKTLKIDRLEVAGRELRGIIKSGEYGYSADFYDTDTDEEIPEARKMKHSETTPFFFLLCVPEEATMGHLILQMFQFYGIKILLQEAFRKRRDLTGFELEISAIISEDVMRKLMSSKIVEVSLVRHQVPKDIADQIYITNPSTVSERRTFKIKGRKRLSRILLDSIKNQEVKFFEVKEEKFDEIKVVVEEGNSRMTLTFGDKYEFAERLPLEDYQKLEGGFPVYEYLEKKAKEYLEHLKTLGDEN